jgi:hypothetical protein
MKANPMNKHSPLQPFSSREIKYRRKIHAAVSELHVYQFERLAFTDAANLPPVNAGTGPNIPRSLLDNVRRFLSSRFSAHWRSVP